MGCISAAARHFTVPGWPWLAADWSKTAPAGRNSCPILLEQLQVELSPELPCKPKRRLLAAPKHPHSSIQSRPHHAKHTLQAPGNAAHPLRFRFGTASINLSRLALPVLFWPTLLRPCPAPHARLIVPCMHPAHVRRYASTLWVAPWEIASCLTLETCRPSRLSRPWCIAIAPLQLHALAPSSCPPVRPKYTDRCLQPKPICALLCQLSSSVPLFRVFRLLVLFQSCSCSLA